MAGLGGWTGASEWTAADILLRRTPDQSWLTRVGCPPERLATPRQGGLLITSTGAGISPTHRQPGSGPVRAAQTVHEHDENAWPLVPRCPQVVVHELRPRPSGSRPVAVTDGAMSGDEKFTRPVPARPSRRSARSSPHWWFRRWRWPSGHCASRPSGCGCSPV